MSCRLPFGIQGFARCIGPRIAAPVTMSSPAHRLRVGLPLHRPPPPAGRPVYRGKRLRSPRQPGPLVATNALAPKTVPEADHPGLSPPDSSSRLGRASGEAVIEKTGSGRQVVVTRLGVTNALGYEVWLT
jgi:hypothetical protein